MNKVPIMTKITTTCKHELSLINNKKYTYQWLKRGLNKPIEKDILGRDFYS